jgi:hypothetical protein
MKKLMLYAKHVNWGLVHAGDWTGTIWRVYDDRSVKIEYSYNPTLKAVEEEHWPIYKKRIEKFSRTIRKPEFQTLLEIIKLPVDDTEVDACDGDAWEFIAYQDDEVLWKRNLGYIYGVKIYETIASLLPRVN